MFFIKLIKYMYDGTIIGMRSMYASQIESKQKKKKTHQLIKYYRE